MLLTIRTLSCPPPDNPQNIHAQFDAAGGRIGRSPPCKLILPDPNRHISREHAEIRLRNDAFAIKVVSKVNSLLVNDAVVGPGEAVNLKDGDQILIGEYLLQADITAGAADAAAPSPFAEPASASPTANPFDVFDSLSANAVKAAPPPPAVPDWFQSPAPAAAPAPQGGASELDDFFNPTPENSSFNELLKDNKPAAPPPAPAQSTSAPVDHRLDDFLGLGGTTDPAPATDPLGDAGADLYRASPLDIPLTPATRPPAPSPTPAAAPQPAPPQFPDDDIFKALEQEFGAPPPPPAVVPPKPEPPVQPPPPPAAPIAAPVAPIAPPGAPIAPPVVPASGVPIAPIAPLAPAAAGQPGPVPDPGQAARQLPPGAAAQTPAVPPMAAPLPAAAVLPPAAGAASQLQTQQLMQALADGLGLQPGDLDNADPEQTIRLVGELLRMSTDGLFRMLEMRSQLKSELHIEDRTMIASRENNPLKHADTPRDAIAYLVDRRQHGNRLFMPPTKAVEDTIWDICAHEMAVMAGTRAALLAALKMFSPEVIEGRIKKTGALENVLPALHKSRLWERFLDMYAQLQHEAEDHFDRLLNQEFSRAYSDQSKKLKKKR
ncbi:type VI secretion system-associated FHA domain protein TagH [Piscinibacter sakaiensis]|uniref:type VI secretion system-associated FHA domain protein TagH n=1 Tax=Piscinibacter sakaiensis TaxID=1547922 RepID=UPI003AAE9731